MDFQTKTKQGLMKIKRKWTKRRKKEETKVNESERPESSCLVFQEREEEELQKRSTCVVAILLRSYSH